VSKFVETDGRGRNKRNYISQACTLRERAHISQARGGIMQVGEGIQVRKGTWVGEGIQAEAVTWGEGVT
jgi:hypothetical protein